MKPCIRSTSSSSSSLSLAGVLLRSSSSSSSVTVSNNLALPERVRPRVAFALSALFEDDDPGTGKASNRSTPSKMRRSTAVKPEGCSDVLAPALALPLLFAPAFALKSGLFRKEARATKALLGLLRDISDEPFESAEDEEDEEAAAVRKAGDDSIRGCSSCGA